MEETRDRILQATASLMRKKGFKAVTTRAIAEEAGVNETTLFRHFGSKKGIVSALVDKYSYVPVFRQILGRAQLELEKDLLAVAEAYQQFMRDHGDMVMIALREAGAFEELDAKAALVPKEFRDSLMEYFATMEQKGLLRKTDIESQAMTFIWMNLGFYVSKSVYGDRVTKLDAQSFLHHSVITFARGLAP
ncbi:TetR/AcrR family transcriptional regulator [Paenibacillus silviterrae]|uniref:TetR/AcrR family transcriptional regulator n=1 Tax=Paenibacillus silviterrae TaxID=3242194 RepID=UPI0025433C0D|nr:TetR/AcrR family transcriptional regulator [Paenibacillus chinjuensis]